MFLLNAFAWLDTSPWIIYAASDVIFMVFHWISSSYVRSLWLTPICHHQIPILLVLLSLAGEISIKITSFRSHSWATRLHHLCPSHLKMCCQWANGLSPVVTMLVSILSHGHPWRLDDLGYPHDLGKLHLVLLQYTHYNILRVAIHDGILRDGPYNYTMGG